MGVVLEWSSGYDGSAASVDDAVADFPTLSDGTHDVLASHVNSLASALITIQTIQATLSPLTIRDEGSVLSTGATSINFTGAGVTATNSGDVITVDITGGGASSVSGPVSSTDNAVVRWDTTTGEVLQNSAVTIDDSGNIATAGTVDGRDVSVDGTKLDGIETGAEVNDVDSVFGRVGAVVAVSGDYASDEISYDNTVSGLTATDVKAALDELQASGGGGGSDDQTATEVPFTANGDIVSTNVQTAIVEVRDDTDTKLGSKADSARNIIAGAGLTGGGDLTADRTVDAVANADGSIVVNANDIQVGVLATDTQHGVRGGGTQHSEATTSVAGFLSGADKTKLDGIEAGAEVNTFEHFDVYNGAPGGENPPSATDVVNLAVTGDFVTVSEGTFGSADYALITIGEDTNKGPAFMSVVSVTGNITLDDATHNNAILNCTAAADISVNIGLSPGFSCVILRNTAATVQIAAGSTSTGIASTAATGSGPINQGEAMTVIALSSTTYTVQGNL